MTERLNWTDLKWTGIGEFNSDNLYIYYCRQESIRRNGIALIVNKIAKCSTWVQFQKQQMITVHFQGKPFNITVIQIYALTSNAKEVEIEWFYDDLQDLLELTTKKDVLFIIRGLECKSRKSRDTWNNGQVWLWNTKWSRAKANSVLPRECSGHSKHPLPITQEKTLHIDITRWSILKSGWLYSLQPKMEKLYTISKNKTGSWLWLRSWTPYCQIQTEIEDSRENH